jgi:WXG100 family type VII secretion target
MAEPLKVDPESLVTSGGVLDQHSQNVFATHTQADQTIESSLFSWVGQSQSALAAKAAAWTTVTTNLTTRLYEHGEGLRVSGMTFAAMDHRDAEELADVYRPNGQARDA